MTPLEALIRESPAMTLTLRTTDRGQIAAMIEAESAGTVRVGWGGGETVEESVIAALRCAAEDTTHSKEQT